ncbi:hypothetical protein COBT_003083 [Conglomerata obtusa]
MNLEIDDIVVEIDLENKTIITKKKETGNASSKCENNFAIFTILITKGLQAILTSITSYKNAAEYVNYLGCILFKLELQDNRTFNNNTIDLCSMTYSNIRFQTTIEETIRSEKYKSFTNVFFYYNYYVLIEHDQDTPYYEVLKNDTEVNLANILCFDNKFLLKFDQNAYSCHYFIFNVVFVSSQSGFYLINAKIIIDYPINLNLFKEIQNILKTKKFNLPKRFILKHDNMKLDLDAKTLENIPLEECFFKPISRNFQWHIFSFLGRISAFIGSISSFFKRIIGN